MNTSNNFGFTPINKIREENLMQEDVLEEQSTNKFGFKPIEKSKPENPESKFDNALRKTTGTLTRALESVIGSAGEFGAIANSITEPLANYLTGISEEEKEKKKDLFKLPTTSDLRKFTKEKTKGYLEPRGKVEKALHEGSELLGSLIGPMKWRKALGAAAGSQLAKEGLGLVGASPTVQEVGKFGTLLSISMINPNGIKKFWQNLYEKRAALTPEGTIVNGKLLENETRGVIKDIKKGTVAPSEAKVLDQAEKVLQKIKNGKVDLNEMVATKRSLNEIAGDPELFKRGEHIFPRLQKAVNSTLALHPDKEAVKLGVMADEAFGAFHESQKLSRFMKRIIGDKPLKSIALSAGIEALAGHPEAIIPTVAAAGIGAGAIKGYELLTRINANPTMRKYYFDMLINASKQNVNAAQKNLRKLDEELSKKEKSKARKG